MIKFVKNRVEFVRKHRKPGKKILGWEELAEQEVKDYNENHVPRAIGMTPLEADKPENKESVKMRLELQRRNRNPQPKLKVGDTVRILRKKKNFEKGYVADYSTNTYKIMDVIQTPPSNQTQYVLDTKEGDKHFNYFKDNKFTRNELTLAK